MSDSGAMAALERRLDDPLGTFAPQGVAFVGPDVPIEVLLASGRSFGHLPWRAFDRTDWADRWLESSFPFWARSILTQWHRGDFDSLDAVVFSRADDASQRLYYYVSELRRRGKLAGPTPRMFDIALVPRALSLDHTETAVAELMQVLGVDEEGLVAGIERANTLRRVIAGIESARSSGGPLNERLARAALWTDPTQWLGEFKLPDGRGRRPRILLAGSMPPDARLHEAVEIAGASVVAETHALAPGRLGPAVGHSTERPARALARHLRQHSVAPRAFLDRASRVVARAREARAAAVVIWLTREDEALAWSLPAQRQALAAAGIPALALPAADWRADAATLDSITGFCRGCAIESA
jgi:hypothetical protein